MSFSDFRKYASYPVLLLCSLYALFYASIKKMPGIEFGWFSFLIGIKLILKRNWLGVGYLINPVNSVRYFEFPFVFNNISKDSVNCLDISSPNMFGFYSSAQYPGMNFRLSNPDDKDIRRTKLIMETLNLHNVQTMHCDVKILWTEKKKYNCISSISVVEHIAGKYNDSDAVRMMYDLLEKGGKLIITIPVDQHYWEEYRNSDPYGTQPIDNGKYFFQRFYDYKAIRERIIIPIGKEPSVVRWFGETEAGRFIAYVKRWMQEGSVILVNDPIEMVNYYREFSDWQEMPGFGVCGLVFEKD